MSEALVDLAFPLRGDSIPADHGYALFGAISRHLPLIHANPNAGIHPIQGRLVGDRRLALTSSSRLTLRLPAAQISEIICLAGKSLDLDGSRCLVGVPSVHHLIPVASLHCQLATIRGFTEPGAFLEAAQRQLNLLEIKVSPSLVLRQTDRSHEGRSDGRGGGVIRRTLHIQGREIVGFALRVEHLLAEESIRLQEAGIGGRRRFGCGIFVPEDR